MLRKLHCLVSRIRGLTNQNKPDNGQRHRVSHLVSKAKDKKLQVSSNGPSNLQGNGFAYKMLSKLHCLVSRIRGLTNQNKPDNGQRHRVSHLVSKAQEKKLQVSSNGPSSEYILTEN